MPLRLRGNLLHQFVNHNCEGVETIIRLEERQVLLGDDRLYDHLAVPDAGVMGAEIAQIGQGVEPVAEDLLVDAEVSGDGFAIGRGGVAEFGRSKAFSTAIIKPEQLS